MTALVDIRNLTVGIPGRFGELTAVNDVSLQLERGEIRGLVGESGAGKSTVGSALIGLLEHPACIRSGSIRLEGQELSTLDDAARHRLRGKRISMIFQDPQTSLNPLLSIAEQLVETIRQHRQISEQEARQLAIELLSETGIENAAQRLDDHPHQFSGGMRQRVVIALALCTEPDVIIADEPTTALDVSVQKQILRLLGQLAEQRGIGILLITHDIGVIAEICDQVTVLRHGKVVESGPTRAVLGDPQQRYTQALMAAVPRLDRRLERFANIVDKETNTLDSDRWRIEGASAGIASRWLLGADKVSRHPPMSAYRDTRLPEHALLRVDDLSVSFSTTRHLFAPNTRFDALSGVSLHLHRGEVLGVVGESGSGKSTLARAITGLVPISGGSMQFQGEALPDARNRARSHEARRRIQMVFQDPYSSLNNRRTVEATLLEPLRFYGLAEKGAETRRLLASVLELVEMPQHALRRYPHQFSGGQRQRIAVARALMARPDFLICDEPTSALDVSIQAQILNLLKDLQSNLGLTILFISHDLPVVRQMADRVAVLRHGKLVESAFSDDFFNAPVADYSRQLLRETPSLEILCAPDAYV